MTHNNKPAACYILFCFIIFIKNFTDRDVARIFIIRNKNVLEQTHRNPNWRDACQKIWRPELSDMFDF